MTEKPKQSKNLGMRVHVFSAPWYQKLRYLLCPRVQIQLPLGANGLLVVVCRLSRNLVVTDAYVLSQPISEDILSKIPPTAYANA